MAKKNTSQNAKEEVLVSKKAKRIIVIAILFAFILSSLYAQVIISQQKKQSDIQTKTTYQQGLKQSTSSKNNSADPLIINSEGFITVGVRYLNPIKDDKDNLVFEVFFDNHQVDLSTLNLSGKILFTTSEGIKVKKATWRIEGSGHHVMAYIKIPKKINGKNLITPKTKYIQLELQNIGGVKSRIYRWDKKFLN